MSRSRRRCLVASAAICVLVAPKDRTHEGPIRAAVEAAEAKALPHAMAAAREKAAALARLSGLTLGAIVSVSDAQTSPYGPFGFYGTFGPDRFCGTVRTSVFKTDKTTGKRKRVGFRTHHTCRVPSLVTSSLTVTFAAS
jgi:type IV secretory pathway TrbL component